MTTMQEHDPIGGLFQIPGEGSLLKKLILLNEPVFEPNIPLVFRFLQKRSPEITLVHHDRYFSMMLPCSSPGLELEAMLITTAIEGKKHLSIYHRLHFDQTRYPGAKTIESDAFLRLAAVVVDVPIDNDLEGLAQLLDYQIREAQNIEITMLTLADGDYRVSENDILPFVMNTIGRMMLAARLDDVAYVSPKSSDELSSSIAQWCDLPLIVAATGVEKLSDWADDVKRSEDAFIAEYASSTTCLMYLYVKHDIYAAVLKKGGFALMKSYLLENAKQFGLKAVTGSAATLEKFKLPNVADAVLNYIDKES